MKARLVGPAASVRNGGTSDSDAASKPNERAPASWVRRSPATRSEVYDTYWRFAAERQEIFFKRLAGEQPPWTSDPILLQFRFTNVYRASDRVSQFLIRHVIYQGEPDLRDVFFRTILFKFFNKIETWLRLTEVFGEVDYRTFRPDAYDEVLTRAMDSGVRIYSAAYIMPSGGGQLLRTRRKHRHHLSLLDQMMRDRVPDKLATLHTMAEAFKLLRGYQSIGDFLAYQYATDVNYSNLTNFTESEFVAPGPGAIDGIRKCFRSLGGFSEADIIRQMADTQEREFERLGLQFRTLWGRPLQLIDCQNLFCEVGKYARVRHPEVQGSSGRTRIKQQFVAKSQPLDIWFPPKWRLNELVAHVGAGYRPFPPQCSLDRLRHA